MTKKEIAEWVRGQAEVDTDDVSDAALYSLIDIYYYRICAAQDWPFAEAVTQVAIPASGVITVPADVENIREARWLNTDGRWLDLDQMNWEEAPTDRTQTGTPQRWYQVGDQLEVFPRPTVASTLILYHYSVPTALGEFDSPVFARPFHYLPGQGALIKIYERLDMFQESRVAKQDFDEGLMQMDQFYLRARQPVVYGGRANRHGGDRGPFYSWEV